MIEGSLIAFTDGSCTGNGKEQSRGGVGVHFMNELPDVSVPLDSSEYKATNQRAELQAVLVAVQRWRESEAKDKPLVIYSDSQYAVKTCSLWMYGWFARGVVKMNWDIVSALYTAISPLKERISFVHVRGH